MSARNQDFVLGAVVLAFIALLIGTVVFIQPSFGGDMRTIEVLFKHDEGVAPIQEGAPVLLSGALQVGKITGVSRREETIDARPDLMIIVEVAIETDLRLYEDCQITTDQPPVGGVGQVVILSVGTPGRRELSAGDVIRGLPPQSFAAAIGNLSRKLLGPGGFVEKLDTMVDVNSEGSLMFKIAGVLDDTKAMTATLKGQLDPETQRTLMSKLNVVMDDVAATTASLRGELSAEQGASAVAKLHMILDGLQAALAEANGLLGENRPVISRTLEHLENVSRASDEQLVGLLEKELDPQDPASLLGKLHAGLDALNASLGNVMTITQSGQATIAENTPAIERTLANVKAMSEQLRLASDEIRAAPWRLLYVPPKGERERITVFDAARTFAEAATYLDDAAARLEAVAGRVDGDGEAEVREILSALRKAFDRFNTAEEFLWEQMKK